MSSQNMHEPASKSQSPWDELANLPIQFDTLAPTEAEKEACENRKEWRRNFLNGHNENPSTLARALYPEPLKLQSETEYSSYTTTGLRQEDAPPDADTTAVLPLPREHKTSKGVFKALASKFVSDMEEAGLQLMWNKTKRPHWYKRLQETSPRIHEARFASGARIQFYCVACVEAKECGLVANGRFLARGECAPGYTNIDDYAMEIEEIYYHSSECRATHTSLRRVYDRVGHALIPAGIDWVLGNRYTDLVQVIEDWPKAGCFFTPGLTKEEKDNILDKWPSLRPLEPEAAKDWLSCGELINFNCPEYMYDDRAYLLLPGHPLGKVLSPSDHYMSMARLLYVIVCRMGIETDVSPFLFDEAQYCNLWSRSNPETKQYKNYRNLYKKNKDSHLSIKEISALFGGNEREICGQELVHQYCHVDGGETISLPSDCTTGFLPGSFILPLSSYGREIYIRNPNQTVKIPFGALLLFAGNLPHGGITKRSECGRQRVAIHGHLDSTWSPRDGGLLDLARIGDNYVAEQHLMLYDIGDHMQHMLEIHELFLQRCREFHKKRRHELDHIVSNGGRYTQATRSVAMLYNDVVQDLKLTTTFGFLGKEAGGDGKKKRNVSQI